MDSVRVAHPLLHAEGGGSRPTSAIQLFFRVVEVDTAVALNQLWHSRLPRIVKSNILRNVHSVCYAAEYEGVFYASAIWSSPVSPNLPQRTWLELRRFAIAPDAPKNTASRMLAWMVRDVKQRFPGVTHLVSYQDRDVHTGTIYRAAGWTATVQTAFYDWNHATRKRSPAQSMAAKQRWEKVIREASSCLVPLEPSSVEPSLRQLTLLDLLENSGESEESKMERRGSIRDGKLVEDQP